MPGAAKILFFNGLRGSRVRIRPTHPPFLTSRPAAGRLPDDPTRSGEPTLRDVAQVQAPLASEFVLNDLFIGEFSFIRDLDAGHTSDPWGTKKHGRRSPPQSTAGPGITVSGTANFLLHNELQYSRSRKAGVDARQSPENWSQGPSSSPNKCQRRPRR